jgi:hypothetical protein
VFVARRALPVTHRRFGHVALSSESGASSGAFGARERWWRRDGHGGAVHGCSGDG